MLVLTRKPGEKIVIGDNIILTIVEIKGDNIRIAIDAPKEIKIYRGEIYDTIVAENTQAAIPINLSDMNMLKSISKKK